MVTTPTTLHTDADLAAPGYVGELGNGLVRRWTTAADTERFALLVGIVFRDERDELPSPAAMAEARAIMGPEFAYMTPNDVAVVEDTTKPERPLVCCTTFWRHRWSYAGIPFDVTRPELVGTHPEYRNRGLVRAVFDMIHARAAAEGHLLQAITGIGYFYRQFGYEYALDLEGSRTAYLGVVPDAPEGASPAGTLRLATQDDIPRIHELYDRRRGASLVWHEANEQHWRFHITHALDEADAIDNPTGARYWMILDAEGKECGYAWVSARRRHRWIVVSELSLEPRPQMADLARGLLRSLRDLALRTPGVRPDVPPCSEIVFELGRSHPLYHLLGEELAAKAEPPYAWYVRVPDLPAFLRRVAPALERRLAGSALAEYTRSVKVDLYRDGFELRFEAGRLVDVARWRAPVRDETGAALQSPPLIFLQLLLGYRSIDELRAFLPDVSADGENLLLVDTLFPKQPSVVDPLG